MPNIYKKKFPNKTIDEENMKKALEDIKRKKATPESAARKYGLKRTTLISRLLKEQTNVGVVKDYQSKYSSNQVLTAAQERDLTVYFKKTSSLHHGLTYDLARRFVFEYVSKYKIKYPPSWDKEKKAGIDWLKCFMHRNNDLSLRKPENTSISRLFAFSQEAVSLFFLNLKKVYDLNNFTSDRIYNIDETGISTVLDSPKVIAEKGKRTVSQAASAERGSLVTMVGIINGSGNHIPPIYVFPRKRMNPNFLKGSVPGSKALLSNNGWMNSELFMDVLIHIKGHARCTIDDPVLLLMDNHVSHCSLNSVIYSRENGIFLLSFPPHTSHKLQPLDVSVFGPFKNFCKQSFNDFIINNPGKRIEISDIASLTRTPFLRAFSPENIIKGFSATGIYPYNSLIFSESDFSHSEIEISSDVTIETNQVERIENCLPTDAIRRPPSEPNCFSPEVIRPLPVLKKKKILSKNQGKSRIYTDSPEKSRLEELREESVNKSKLPKLKLCKKTKTLRNPKAKKQRKISSSSSEDGSYSLADSDKSFDFGDDLSNEETALEVTDGIPFESENPMNEHKSLEDEMNIKENTFVLVKFTNKTDLYFIGVVVEVNTSTCIVKFLRRQLKTQIFYEPNIEDKSLVSKQDIVRTLPTPEHPPGTSRTQGKFIFNVDFSNLDVR